MDYSTLFVILFIPILFVFLDALFYGIFLEKNIKGLHLGNGFLYQNKIFDSIFEKFQKPINWLMEEKEILGFQPIKYRILQKIFEIGFAFFVFKNYGIICLSTLICSYYLMTFEYGYYLFLGQRKYISSITNAPWLTKWYFSGLWLFKPNYSFDKFTGSYLVGLLFLIISLIFANI